MPISSQVHWPFQQITMDFITNLPSSDGFDSIFIMVDQGLTKGVILMPCNKTITTDETANLYIQNVFKNFGLPDVMISNWGPQFASYVFNGIMNSLKVKHKMSTAFCYELVDLNYSYEVTSVTIFKSKSNGIEM